ncbi:MAG TPA: ATP-binding protein, partial [Minicystis sp.]|nr:ATP-binding protein [Minicystis sp.]
GAGPRGLAVLPPRAPVPGCPSLQLVRPMLFARRADVLAHLARHGLSFSEDPSNADPRFARTRVRRELLPLLEAMAPRVVEHLSDLADMLGEPPSEADARLVELGRSQRKSVSRARRLGKRRVLLRVRGGKDVSVTFPHGGGVLIEDG